MVTTMTQKVTKEHLQRKAYLYVRQSSLRQVRVHQESTKQQYALQQRAAELGWPRERIVVIDNDQGHSGASMADRKGFQQLVADVGIGNAGIVLGLEVSRLARNNSDWHRLLEICGLTHTLILDEDGLYDPCDFNDRLLLGLKGTMSEAELHILKARMRGGVLNKAHRGELHLHLPVGLVYDSEGKVILDPDKQVQQSLRLLFESYRRIGTARGVVIYFHEQGLLFPRHPHGQIKQELDWKELYSALVRDILHNPRYAGAYVYGRTRETRHADGSISRISLPREQWKVLIKDVHKGYISWDEFEKNEKQLLTWVQARNGQEKRQSPPREGCALLQGIAICGICGKRMTVHYHKRAGGDLVPRYACNVEQCEWAGPTCQGVMGDGMDKAVGELLMESVTPLTLEVALNIQKELQQRFEEADKIRRQQVDRAQYEANLAQRRYLQVDPDNRLVAESLETQWNEKLCVLQETQEQCERLRQHDHMLIDEKKRKEILTLAKDFPRLWRNPKVSHRDRKRMARLLLEDVTVLVGADITLHIRFKGGATKTLSVPKPRSLSEQRRTNPDVVKEIDHLLDHHLPGEIATMLNERGFRSGGSALPFTGHMVSTIQRHYRLKSRHERLRERGMLNVVEMAQLLDVATATVFRWQQKGMLKRREYTTHKFLFEPPGDQDYQKCVHFRNRAVLAEDDQNDDQEVQYE